MANQRERSETTVGETTDLLNIKSKMDLLKSSYAHILLRLGMLIFLIRFATVTSSIPIRGPKELARGFGKHINWTTFHDGLVEAGKLWKPIMLLIHQEECPACKDFGPRFAEDEGIADWSKYFTMINCKDEEEPMSPAFSPDGRRYYPRILFMSPKGQVLADVINEQGSPAYRYYYFTSESVLDSMLKVMQRFYDIAFEGAEDL